MAVTNKRACTLAPCRKEAMMGSASLWTVALSTLIDVLYLFRFSSSKYCGITVTNMRACTLASCRKEAMMQARVQEFAIARGGAQTLKAFFFFFFFFAFHFFRGGAQLRN